MKEGTKGSSSRLQSILETMEGRGPNWGRHGLCNVDPYVILMALVKRTPIGPPQGSCNCYPNVILISLPQCVGGTPHHGQGSIIYVNIGM